jgi:hypothetical protein
LDKETNFWDGEFPSIEIDVDYLKGLSKMDRAKYILRLFFQEKDLGNRVNLLNYIFSGLSKVGKVFIKNKQFQEYMKLLDGGTKLVAISAALGNVVKTKQNYKHIKNNEIAKLMGFPNGNYVNSVNIEVTQAMLEAFLSMNDYHKQKYKIVIDKTTSTKNDNAAGKSDKEEGGGLIGVQKMMIVGHIDKEENKFGIVVNFTSSLIDSEEDTTNVSTAKLFFPVTGSTLIHDQLKDTIEKIIYELYVEKVDTSKNFIRVNGNKLEICERINIKENIRNIDIDKLRRSIDKTLKEGSRRGIVFVGEPGVGKTISVHKLINYFPKNLVFWIKPDSISTVSGIRNTFKIFEMFENSIMVFDDIDSAALTKKDEVTNEFLVKLDGTSKLKGFIIATVNDPSKLHPALINRPERFDEAIEVKTPHTHEEISEILESKSMDSGYYYKKDAKNAWHEVKGPITVELSGKKNKELTKLYDDIIKMGLTQVQIAGLVRNCHQYHGEISVKSLRDAYDSCIRSISCANMIAKKGKLVESDDLSEESKANLYRDHKH